MRLHPGLHISVDLGGTTQGGTFMEPGTTVTGVVVATDAMGVFLTVQLDTPVGGGQPHGVFGRPSKPVDLISVEPSRATPIADAAVMPSGVPDEIVAMARAGKRLQAVKAYRALNGASLDEAQAWLHSLGL